MGIDVGVLLSQTPILAGVSQTHLQALASRAEPRRFRVRDEIFGPGHHQQCWLIHQGRVRIGRVTRNREFFLRVARAGDLCGLEQLYGGHGQVRGVSLELASAILLPTEAVVACLEDSPVLATRLYAQTLASQQLLLSRLDELVSFNVPQRLMRFLLYLAETYGSRRTDGGLLIDVGLSHQDLAASVGTSRETATTLLNDLKEAGLIDIGRRTLTVINAEGLRERLIN